MIYCRPCKSHQPTMEQLQCRLKKDMEFLGKYPEHKDLLEKKITRDKDLILAAALGLPLE